MLHLVNDALPTASAGYTIRTHEIVLAQQAAGLDPHVVTRCGFPVTQGTLDGRRLVTLDGIPYHRLLPWRLPGRADKAAALGLEMAARLTEQIAARPARREQLRQRHDRAGPGGAVRAARGVRGARVLGGHLAVPAPGRRRTRASSELYRRNRDLETRCMLAADLVVTLGEAMRDEIVARGVPAEKVLIVPNAVSEEFLRPLPDAGALRKELGLEPDEHVVGVVSSLVPHEGIGTLLEATRLLRTAACRCGR